MFCQCPYVLSKFIPSSPLDWKSPFSKVGTSWKRMRHGGCFISRCNKRNNKLYPGHHLEVLWAILEGVFRYILEVWRQFLWAGKLLYTSNTSNFGRLLVYSSALRLRQQRLDHRSNLTAITSIWTTNCWLSLKKKFSSSMDCLGFLQLLLLHLFT